MVEAGDGHDAETTPRRRGRHGLRCDVEWSMVGTPELLSHLRRAVRDRREGRRRPRPRGARRPRPPDLARATRARRAVRSRRCTTIPTGSTRPACTATPAAWDDVLDDLADRIAAVRAEHGNDAVGAYLATGLAYDLNGWHTAERFLGLLHTKQRYTPVTIDNAAILRAAELVAGNMQLSTVWDPEDSKLLVVFGTNPVVSHGYGTTLVGSDHTYPRVPPRRRRAVGPRSRCAPRPPRSPTATSRCGPAPTTSCSPGSCASCCATGADDGRARGAHRPRRRRAAARRCSSRARSTASPRAADVAPRAARRAARRDPPRGSARVLRRHRRGDAPHRARGRVAALGAARGHRLGRSSRRHAREPRLPVPARGSPVPRRAARGLVRRLAAEPSRPAALGRPVPVRGDGRRDRGRQPARAAHPRRQSADRVPRPRAHRARVPHARRARGGRHPRPRARRARDARAAGDRAARARRPPDDRRPRAVDRDAVHRRGRRAGRRAAPGVVDARASSVVASTSTCSTVSIPTSATTARCSRASPMRVAATPRPCSRPDRAASNGPAPSYGWVHDQVLPDGRWRLAPRALVERLRDDLDRLDDAHPEYVLTARRQLRNMNSARYEQAERRGSEQPWVRCNPDDVARLGLADGDAVVLTNAYGTTTGVAAGRRPGAPRRRLDDPRVDRHQPDRAHVGDRRRRPAHGDDLPVRRSP